MIYLCRSPFGHHSVTMVLEALVRNIAILRGGGHHVHIKKRITNAFTLLHHVDIRYV